MDEASNGRNIANNDGAGVLRNALLRAVAERLVRPSDIDATLTALMPLAPYVLDARLALVAAGEPLAGVLILAWQPPLTILDRRWIAVSWPVHTRLRFWVYDEPMGLTLNDVLANEIERRLSASLARFVPVRGETLPADGWDMLPQAVSRVPVPLSPRDSPAPCVAWCDVSCRWLSYVVVSCLACFRCGRDEPMQQSVQSL